MHFGKWIIVAFILFTLFIASLVTICVMQDVNLVSLDYYKQAQEHQQKMNYEQNANEIANPPKITALDSVIRVSFTAFDQLENGKLQLFRPSNNRLDYIFSLRPSKDTTQHFTLPVWSRGLYRVSMQWSMHGKQFYLEKQIVL